MLHLVRQTSIHRHVVLPLVSFLLLGSIQKFSFSILDSLIVFSVRFHPAIHSFSLNGRVRNSRKSTHLDRGLGHIVRR